MSQYKKRLFGSGGNSASSQQVTPTSTPNTLRSEDTVEMVVGLGEGPIYGLSNGLKDLKFGTTAVQQDDGTNNFQDVTVNFFPGEANPQPVIFALGGASNNSAVNTTLAPSVAVTRQTTSGDIDSIQIRLVVNSLYKNVIGGSQPGIFTDSYQFKIRYRPVGTTASGWTVWTDAPYVNADANPYYTSFDQYDGGAALTGTQKTNYYNQLGWSASQQTGGVQGNGIITINGKTTSPYVKEYRIPVQRTPQGYYVEVTQISGASADPAATADGTYSIHNVSWESFQEIDTSPKTYPNTAILQMVGKATNQFTSIPQISGKYKGLIVRVPSNYNALTHIYSGTWDGTWSYQWTNNPVWLLYEAITNTRWGWSAYTPVYWSQYEAYNLAQYCDALLTNPDGVQVPRYTFNAVIQDPMDGRDFCRYIAGSFNSVIVDDNNGNIHVLMDKNDAAIAIVGKESIIGDFEYTYTDVNTRYNDITVVFQNPDLNYAQDRRRIYNQASINQFGRIPYDFVAIGTTNEWEATRKATRRIIQSNTETEMVTFKTNRIAQFWSAYDVILVADTDKAQGYSGRFSTLATTTSATLRDGIFLETGATYQIIIQDKDQIYTRNITTTGGAVRTTLSWDTAIPATVSPNAQFALSQTGTFGIPKPYRILTKANGDGPDDWSVMAIELNRLKFTGEDTATQVGEPTYIFPVNSTPPDPTNVKATNTSHIAKDGTFLTEFRVDFTPPDDPYVTDYFVRYRLYGESEWNVVKIYASGAFIPTPYVGNYEVQVQSENSWGQRSNWIGAASTVLTAKTGTPAGGSIISAVGGFRRITVSVIYPAQADIKYAQLWSSSTSDIATATFRANFDGTEYVDSNLIGIQTRYYWLKFMDTQGTVGSFVSTTGISGTTTAAASSDTDLTAIFNGIAAVQAATDSLITTYGTTVAAAASASAASASATTASTAAGNAATANTNAQAAMTAAQTAQTAATTQATNAATSATAASGSATGAANSATSATTAATNATTQATNSSNSATAAAGSASTATSQASQASTSATAAAASATAANTSAGNASTSAGQAATSNTNAQTAATNANTQATNAATSATAASGSATSAATSATNAATSASSASSSSVSASLQAFQSFPSAFEAGISAWTSDPTGGSQTTAPAATGTVVNGTYRITGPEYFAPRGLIEPLAGRTYRATVVGRQIVDPTSGGSNTGLYFTPLGSDFKPASARYTNIAVTNGYTFSRTQAAFTDYGLNASPITVAANTIRQSSAGLLMQATLTNRATWNRDFTNAIWTKTNITAAKTQTGIDGVANSASLLTATAANGTVTQSITDATARFRNHWAYIKRVTGTGSVYMTLDGTTWVDITSQLTGAFLPIGIPVSSSATTNPVVGFKIATSGDAIAVDYYSAVNGSIMRNTAIANTTGTASISSDILSHPATTVPTVLVTEFTWPTSLNYASAQYVYNLSDGTNNNRVVVYISTTGVLFARVDTTAGGAVVNISLGAGFTAGQTVRLAMRLGNNDFAVSVNGAAVVTDTTVTYFTPTIRYIGSLLANSQFDGYIRQIQELYTTRTNTQLQAMSVPGVALDTEAYEFRLDFLNNDYRVGLLAGTYTNVVTGSASQQVATVAAGKQTSAIELTPAVPGANDPALPTYYRPYIYLNLTAGNGTYQLESFKVEDVTQSNFASTQATAAATSASNAAVSATAAGTSATSASTQATNAATSAGAASTSATQASTSATNAAGSATTATTQATNSATSASAALGSANSANTYATNASTSATAAATSATSANTSATNASTSAGNASTYATNASNSATTATGAANTATTQATNASNSATAAAGSSTSASGFASTASTQATNAANSATSAQGFANTATSQAANALSSAGAASTSASGAATSATNAATSSSAANSSAVSATTTAALLLPERVSTAGNYFSVYNADNISPTTAPPVPSSTSGGVYYTNDGTLGLIVNGVNTPMYVITQGGIPYVPGRTYEVEVEYEQTVNGAASRNADIVAIGYNNAWAIVSSGVAYSPAALTSGVANGARVKYKWQFADTATSTASALGSAITSGAAYLRFGFRGNLNFARSDWGYDATVKLLRLSVRDVTGVVAAAGSASAAATSASNAATSQSAAGTSASAAATSATNASTSAGNANTYATNASTSATNALGYSNTASTSAGNAATSATNAGNSATAANTSASTASTQASNASGSATAAAGSATTASGYSSSASGSAGAAATSAASASGSASAAATSAALVASFNPGNNLVKNPTYKQAFFSWTASGSVGYIQNNIDGRGFAYITTAGSNLVSDNFPAAAGYQYSLSVEMSNGGITAGNARAYVQWLDSGGAHVAYSAVLNATSNGWVRYTTGTTPLVPPAGTTQGRVIFDAYSVSNFGGQYIYVSRFKLEQAATCTPFTDDASWTQVSDERSARASADAALSSSISTVTASVSGLTSTVSTQATAISTLQGYTAARLVTSVVAGGAITEFTMYASGSAGSLARIKADYIALGNTDVLVISGGTAYLTNAYVHGNLTIDGTLTTNKYANGSVTNNYYGQSSTTFYGATSGTSNPGGSGGYVGVGDGGDPPSSCVAASSFTPTGKSAGSLVAEDDLYMLNENADGWRAGKVVRNELSNQPSYRLTTAGGITLVCSTSTPIYTRGGAIIPAMNSGEKEVPVLDNGVFGWDKIIRVDYIGYQDVMKIDADDGVYAAGETDGRYIFTHNKLWN